MDFSEQVVLVTGASGGIGRSVAVMFAEKGAQVAVHFNRDTSGAQRTLASLPEGTHKTFQADVSDGAQAQNLIDEVVTEMGGIHVLVNNAGMHETHKILEIDYGGWQDQWDRTLRTNLIGPANLTYWASRHMMKHGGGRIVNVSSRGAFRGEPEAPAYGASKGGLNSMSQSLAKALAPHNIFVYVVAPGFVETEMAASMLSGPRGAEIRKQSPLGRVARPEEVAHTVLFLASEGSEFLTGCIVDVNGASYLRV
jgi:NAD(P)-dependent dehydrogenase (short-subunit alcohol dehydrogenase family)